METLEYQGKQIRRWQIGSSTFLVWPEVGARLMNWHVSMADGSVRDIIHWPEEVDWSSPAEIRGGNPVLFPFSGRCWLKGEKGKWAFEEQVLPMPMHGFAAGGRFEIIDIRSNGFEALLCPTAEDALCYPFKYEFSVVYRFQELSLVVELRLKNLDSKIIPWSGGNHFYFNLPWNPGAARKDYRIKIPAKKAYYQSDDGRLVATAKPEPETDFEDRALYNRIHTNLKSADVVFGPKSGEEDITVVVGAAPIPGTETAVVTWTEFDDSPYYCVEPWMGPPNAPEHKKGLAHVEPGKMGVFSTEIRLY